MVVLSIIKYLKLQMKDTFKQFNRYSSIYKTGPETNTYMY